MHNMSFYVTVNSDECLQYFPENMPYHFRTHLQSSQYLNGNWKVALLDIQMSETGKNGRLIKDNLYIHCDVCSESILDGEKENLLRMVKSVRPGKWTQEFLHPHYITVNKSEIRDIEFYIKSKTGELLSFFKKPVTLTLHFRSYPFFC